MGFLIFFSVCFVSVLDVTCGGRYKRLSQFPNCTNGQGQSVSLCFKPQMQCNGNYYCDTTGYCCPNVSTTFPKCPSGINSSALCINGGCNLGYQCNTVGSQKVCCNVCPNNATSSGACTTNSQCTTSNTECHLFNQTNQGLCCPRMSTQSCPNNAPSSGTCPTGSCNANFGCVNGTCCPVCPNNGVSTGLCQSGNTCTTGFNCMNGICCPSAVQPTGCANNVAPTGTCSPTTACANAATQTCNGTVCCPMCPNSAQSPGVCVSNSCSGFPAAPICNQGICCPNSFQGACPMGQTNAGACLSGTAQCPGGFSCIDGNCCGTSSRPVVETDLTA